MTVKSPIRNLCNDITGNLIGKVSGDNSIIHPNELAWFDATDSASYSGSGQVWTDVINGHELYRGVDGTSESGNDPQFNGTSGDDGAYWSTPVNDSRFFTSKSLPTLVEEAYKSTSNLTVVTAMKTPTANDFWDPLCVGTPSGGTNDRGMRFMHALGSGYIRIIHKANGQTKFAQVNASGGEMASGSRNLITIVNMDMTTGNIILFANGSKYTGTLDTTFADTNDNAAGHVALCGATRNSNGSTYGEMPANGFEWHGIGFIEGGVTDSEAADIKTKVEALTGRTY